MTQLVKVTDHYELKFDGSIDNFVAFADLLAGGDGTGEPDSAPGLGTFDAGDAVGFFIDRLHHWGEDGVLIDDSDKHVFSVGTLGDMPATEILGDRVLVTVTRDQDLFVWDPPHPD